MKPGDLIRLSNRGSPVRVIPDMHPRPLEMVIDYPPGTVALIEELRMLTNPAPLTVSWAV